MNALCDETIPRGVAAALRHVGYAIHHVSEVLERGAPDRATLRLARGPRHVLLTRRRRAEITHAYCELLAWSGVGAFVLAGARVRNPSENLVLLIQAWPSLQAFAAEAERPFVCAVSDRVELERLGPGW